MCVKLSRALIKNMVAGCLGTGRSGTCFDLKEELTGGVRELHSAVHHSLWFNRRRGYFDGLRNRKARLLVELQHKTDFKEDVVRFLLTCQKPMRKKVSGRFHSSLQCFRVSRCLLADHCHLLQKGVCHRRNCPYVLLLSSNLCRSNLTPCSYNVNSIHKNIRPAIYCENVVCAERWQTWHDSGHILQKYSNRN